MNTNVNPKKETVETAKSNEVWVFGSVCVGIVGALVVGICVGSKYKKSEGIRIPEEE